MSPIKDLSDSVRLPRLGKFHLGIRHPEKGYPMKTEYFVLPQDHPDYEKLVEAFGDKPKELRILIPVEDEEQWASQYYKAYNLTYGLVCKGDGEMGMRMCDVDTGALPNKDTKTCELREWACNGRDCTDYKEKKCSEVMNVRFILPEIPGLGIWQIDTGSKNSILNINSCAKIIRKAFGRISMIPLKLTFEPIEVNNPDTGKKHKVYVLNLRTDVTMEQLAEAAREQSHRFLIEGPDLEAVYEEQVKKDIELWGEEDKSKPIDEETVEIIEAEPLFEDEPPISDEAPTPEAEVLVDESDVANLKALMQEKKVSHSQVGFYCKSKMGWPMREYKDLTKQQFGMLCEAIEKGELK